MKQQLNLSNSNQPIGYAWTETSSIYNLKKMQKPSSFTSQSASKVLSPVESSDHLCLQLDPHTSTKSTTHQSYRRWHGLLFLGDAQYWLVRVKVELPITIVLYRIHLRITWKKIMTLTVDAHFAEFREVFDSFIDSEVAIMAGEMFVIS